MKARSVGLPASVQGLPLIRGRNFELFPVFGNRAPRQHEPFTMQGADDRGIAQRLARVLILDDLANALFDGDRRDALAVRAADAAVEEIGRASGREESMTR